MSPSTGRLPQQMRLRRAELGLSVRRSAKLARVDRESWRMWEAGRYAPRLASHGGIERALQWRPGSVSALLGGGEATPVELPPEPDYRDAERDETYTDPVECGLWDLRHRMAMLYVTAYGEERARELGEADARKHIDDWRADQAKLRRMTEPRDARTSQVA